MTGSHFQTILWLRRRLTCNQLSRGGRWNARLALVMNTLKAVLLAAAFAGAFSGAYTALSSAPAWIHLLTWDVVTLGFLFLMATHLAMELQRSEAIDFGRLLHLPVCPKQIFFVNFAASCLTAPWMLAAAVMGGLSLGLLAASGAACLFLFPLITGFLFMIAAWTYCLRGWLTALLLNKRRRNTVLVLIVAFLVLLLQVPNLYFHVVQIGPENSGAFAPPSSAALGQFSQEAMLNPTVLELHQCLPVLWVPYGAFRLVQGSPWPALLASAGLWLLGIWGLAQAYHSTVHFYLRTKSRRRNPQSHGRHKAPKRRDSFMEWRLPLIPNQSAALALASFRMLFRAPEARIMLVMPVLMTFLYTLLIFRESRSDLAIFLEPFLPAGLSFTLLFGLMQIAMNQFGLDRSGFRALMLVPVQRHQVLLAKNLSLFGLGLGLNLFLLALLGLVRHVSWDLLLSGVLQFVSGFLLLCVLGNWASVLLPYYISPSTLKSNQLPKKISAVILLCHVVFPLLLSPIFLPMVLQVALQHHGYASSLPVGLLASAGLFLVTLTLYGRILLSQGQLLWKRQAQVLATVTASLD